MSTETSILNEENAKALAAYDKSRRYRFQEQCYLNFWKEHIFEKLNNQPRLYRPIMQGASDPWNIEAQAFEGTNDDTFRGKKGSHGLGVYEYSHINTIDAVEPAKMVSLFNQKNGAASFFRLDSSILTQLKPTVELYKIYPSISSAQSEPDVPAPPSSLERTLMPLGENIRAGKEGIPSSRRDLSSIENLFYDHNVLGNAMLTDLSFKFAGENIALLNTVEEVSFTLSFSSFNLFSHKFEVQTEKGKRTWSYQDLISYSTRYMESGADNGALTGIDSERGLQGGDLKCYETAEKFVGPSEDDDTPDPIENSKYFEIQMAIRYDPEDIDWNMVDMANAGNNTGRLNLNESERKELKSFLRNSAMVLRLQFVAHTIRYNSKSSGADPELLIDFEYKAFIESTLNSSDLDLLKLRSGNGTEIYKWETRLKHAKKLLEGVKRDKKTLHAIFGAKGTLKNNLNDQYQHLRGALDKDSRSRMKEKELRWLIHSPVRLNSRDVYAPSEVLGIVPVKPKNKKEERVLGAHAKRVRYDLQYNEDDLDSALGSTGNARLVFMELIEKITAHIKMLRRIYTQERYKNLFEALFAQERIYSLNVQTKDIGWGSEGVKPEKEMAKTRKKELASGSTKPSGITIVRTTSKQDEMKGPLKKLINKFEELDMSRLDVNMSNQIKTVAQQVQEELGKEPFSEPEPADGSTIVYFTNLGDLIDTAITIASYPDYGLFKRRVGILLGPLLDRNNASADPKKHSILNLAWVPVSLKLLMGFFATKVLASGKERYLLNDFIKDLIGDLILPALGSRCVEDAHEGNQQIGAITFTTEMHDSKYGKIPPFYSPRPLAKTDRTQMVKDNYPPGGGATQYLINDSEILRPAGRSKGGAIKVERIPWGKGSIKNLTQVSPNTPIDEQFHYMFIYVNNISPIRLQPEKEKENIENGIYYLHLGQIPSIVKNAVFKKEPIPFVREARAMGQLTKTGGLILRDVYHFQCNMYGNNIFKPGMLLFVDPTKDGSTDYDAWKELGLVGFYRVHEVDHQINTGMAPIHETSLSAKWVTFGSCGDKKGLIDPAYKSIRPYQKLGGK
jgi:hypothetical protein